MFSKHPRQKIEQLTRQIPALAKIPHEERLKVFKSTFTAVQYRIFLCLIFFAFVLLFYFNFDPILEYRGPERGGFIVRSLHFFKELGTTFFLPLMVIMMFLVLGRNFFVKKQVEKYMQPKKPLNW